MAAKAFVRGEVARINVSKEVLYCMASLWVSLFSACCTMWWFDVSQSILR